MKKLFFYNSFTIKIFATLSLIIAINGINFGSTLVEMKIDQTFDQLINPPGSVGFFPSAPPSAGESNGAIVLTVNRFDGSDGAISVDYILSDFFATGGSSCTPGVDYINTGGRINFADRQLTQTFTIPLCDDSLDEFDEGIRATLVNPIGTTIVSTFEFTQARILDDDPTPTVSVNDVSQIEGSSGGSTLRFTLSLSAPSGRQISISFNTADGTATANVDYTRLDNSFTFFEAGEVTKQIPISLVADARVEPDETFSLNLSNPQSVLIGDEQGIGTIINDDIGGSVQFGNTTYNIVENAGSVAVTLTRANGNASDVIVQYATSNGTATAGQDYTTVNGSLNFGANETVKSFNVPIINDSIRETDETINLSLNAISGGATLGVPSNATILIVNDDRGITAADFDGDGKSDISVFRPDNGSWYMQQSTAGFTGLAFGISTDKLVPADYDGDGKTDVAVYRGGTWYLQRSQLGFTGMQFGATEDIPVPADYDGDGKADLAVFRPSNGTWYLQRSRDGFTGIQFGQSGDKPVAADYDGDGKADLAVNRSGIWYLQQSSAGFTALSFGDANDKLVPADYDGDGKSDVAVFRPSNGVWYLQQSTNGFAGIQFGLGTDLPTAADYDGDGKADLAVFRNGVWYLNRTTQGFTGIAFGAGSDKPVPNAFVQ